MGHRHSRDEILEHALAVATDEGLGRLSFGRVARRAGTSDRMVVYYFPTRSDLEEAVLQRIAEQLQGALGAAFATPAADHRALLRAAWPVLARPQTDAVFALYFEACGLAAAGVEPYQGLAPQLFGAWVEWLTGSLMGTPAERRREAEATLAMLDGLLLVRQLAGAAAANRAATVLGVR